MSRTGNKKELGLTFERTSIDDSDLIEGFKSGDKKVFEIIVLKYRNRLIQSAYAILRDEWEAQDLVQETFVKAYSSHNSFRGDSSVYTWLYRILYNLCISNYRRKKVFSVISFDKEDSPELPSGQPDPSENLESSEITGAVKRAMEKLPLKQRMIFAMKQMDGLKHEEIAKIMGITEGAVKASYFHAIQKLRELLKRYRGEYEL